MGATACFPEKRCFSSVAVLSSILEKRGNGYAEISRTSVCGITLTIDRLQNDCVVTVGVAVMKCMQSQ